MKQSLALVWMPVDMLEQLTNAVDLCFFFFLLDMQFIFMVWSSNVSSGTINVYIIEEWFFTPGAGFGPGIPGLQVGLGFGVGCGVGLGFGYGMGKGVAQDGNRRSSNVGNLSHGLENFPSQ